MAKRFPIHRGTLRSRRVHFLRFNNQTVKETPRVDLICILFLSIEFIFFGSMHFTRLSQTVQEIPDCFPYKISIAVITGMFEVVAGILILIPRTRKLAAWILLGLLVAFLPAIFKILADKKAMDAFEPWQNLVRVLLMPNQVVLGLAAVHLLRSNTTTARTAQLLECVLRGERQSTPPVQRARVSYRAALIIAGVMLMANVAGFAIIRPTARPFATVHLWGMTCLATGALIGFLFAVPRASTDPTLLTHRPNSNIEVISDWLTKIIVGVGLIEFRQLGEFLNGISVTLAQALEPRTTAAFAQALIVYFFVAGIIQGYLLTRLYVGKQFEGLESRGGLVVQQHVLQQTEEHS